MVQATAREPMIVRVGKGPVMFPRDCCCCGAPADHEEKIERKKTIPLGIARITRAVTLGIPCCATCQRNVRWQAGLDGFIGRTVILSFLMLFLGFFLGNIIAAVGRFDRVGPRFSTAMILIIGVGVFAFWLVRRYRKYVAKPIDGHICSDRTPVGITNFDANSTTLAFQNFDFGTRVAAMNAPQTAAASA